MGLNSKLFKGDSALEACLVSDPAHITQGAIGEHVGKIQKALGILDGARIDAEELASKRYGASTAAAVLAFKKKRNIVNRSYQTQADDIVGKMTMAALDREMVEKENKDGRFDGFTDEQIATLKGDLDRANRFLTQVVLKLSGATILPTPVAEDTSAKVGNVFKTVSDNPDPFTLAFRQTEIFFNFRVLKPGMAQNFPLHAEPGNSLGRAAYVIGTDDPMVHVHQNYFTLHQDDRAVTLIHERAHTLLKISGHPGTGDVLFCVVPHLGVQFPVITYDDAIHNAYCYELLSLALQPDYNPGRFRNNPMCTSPRSH